MGTTTEVEERNNKLVAVCGPEQMMSAFSVGLVLCWGHAQKWARTEARTWPRGGPDKVCDLGGMFALPFPIVGIVLTEKYILWINTNRIMFNDVFSG